MKRWAVYAFVFLVGVVVWAAFWTVALTWYVASGDWRKKAR